MRKAVLDELLDRNTDERFYKLDIVTYIGLFSYIINYEITKFNDCLSQIYQHNLSANFMPYIRQLYYEIIKWLSLTNLSTQFIHKFSCTIYNNMLWSSMNVSHKFINTIYPQILCTIYNSYETLTHWFIYMQKSFHKKLKYLLRRHPTPSLLPGKGREQAK